MASSNILVNFLFGGNAQSLQAAAAQANAALGSTNKSLIEQRVRFLAATAVVSGFAAALAGTVKSLIETSAEFQRLATSFVSILAEPLLDAKAGAALTKENLAVLRSESANLFKEAQRAAVDTVATTKEYVQLLQAALAVGQQQGLAQEEVLVITKRLALAAGAFGIDFEKASSSIAQILAGSVRVTNQLGRNLGLATAENRKLLQTAIQNGTLFEFLEKKTRNFAATAKDVADNFLNVKAAIGDIFQLGGTAAVKPLFDFISQQLVQFRDKFFAGEGGLFTPALQKIIAGFQDFFKQIVPALVPLIDSFGNLFNALGGQGGNIATIFKVILSTLTGIVNVLAQIISGEGFGGLIRAAIIFNLALKATNTTVALGGLLYKNLALNIGLATSAATSLAVRLNAIGGALSTFARTAVLIFAIVEAMKAFGGATEDALESLTRLNKTVDDFADKQQKFAKNTNLRDLISEYTSLTEQQSRTFDEETRLVEVTQLLERAFGKVGFEAFKAGKTIEGQFASGQSILNQRLEGKINDLARLRDALILVSQGAPSQRLIFLESDNEANKKREEELEKQRIAFEQAKQNIIGLSAEYRLNFNPANLESAEAIEAFRVKIEQLLQQFDIQLEKQNLLTKSHEQLIELLQEELKVDGYSEKSKQRLNQISAALYQAFLNEADGHRATALAAAEAAKTKTQLAIDELDRIQRINEALTEQAALYSAVGAFPEDIKAQNEYRERLARSLAEYESVIAKLKARPKPSTTTAGGRGERDRDELKDYLAEVQRQFDIIKKAADGLEKESSRIIDINRKVIQSLADAGVITLADAIARQRQLIDEEFALQKRLADNQLEFIQNAEKLGEAVAKRTEERTAREKERVPGKTPGTTRARGGEGFDNRERKEELLKLASEEIAILNKLAEDARRAEELRTELVSKEVKNRIELRKEERISIDQASKDSETTIAAAQTALQKLGLLSQENLAQGELGRSRADLERRREALLFQLNPLADKEFRELLKEGLEETAALGGALGREAAGLQQGLIAAGQDPALLEDLRVVLQESIKNEGLIDQLLKARISKLNQIALGVAELEAFVAKAKQVDAQLAKAKVKGEKPADALLEEQKAAATAIINGQKRLAQINQESDAVKRILEILLQVATTEAERIKIRSALNSVQKEGEQNELAALEKALQIKEDQLALQFRLIDFDNQRLDILEQLNRREAELGIKIQAQADARELSLIGERERLLLSERAGKNAQLGTINPNVTADSAQAETRRQLQLDIAQLDVRLFELRNRAFELRSPLIALRDAFKDIGSAVASLPEPFNKLSSIFTGLEHLLDVIIRKQRPQAPEVVLQEASTNFGKAVTEFQKAVDELRQFILNLIGSPDATRPRRVGEGGSVLGDVKVEGGADADKAKKDIENDTRAKIVGIIRAAGKIVAGILGGIANKDAGQVVSGIGAGLQSVPDPSGITQAIGAVTEIVGGVISFFSASAKQKTRELADVLRVGIQDVKDALSTGAIGLGEGIRELQAKLEDARRQLSGRKGGEDELKKIEADIEAEKKRLRAEAKRLQDDFRDQLNLLRQPKSLRDTITAVRAISDAAQKFIQSFENPADALAAVAETQEFIRISIKELKDEIEKTLKDLQQNLRDATEQFASNQRAILLEGRIDPRVSIAQSKRERLVSLEREFQKNKIELENQIAAEQAKLSYVESRDKIEKRIAQLARHSAEAMGLAADKLSNAANSLERAFNAIQGFNFNNGAAGPVGPQTVTLNFRVNGEEAGSTTVGVGTQQHLEMAGLLSSSRLNRFHPRVSN